VHPGKWSVVGWAVIAFLCEVPSRLTVLLGLSIIGAFVVFGLAFYLFRQLRILRKERAAFLLLENDYYQTLGIQIVEIVQVEQNNGQIFTHSEGYNFVIMDPTQQAYPAPYSESQAYGGVQAYPMPDGQEGLQYANTSPWRGESSSLLAKQ